MSPSTAEGEGDPVSPPERLAKARAVMLATKPAIQGEEGNAQTCRLAGKLVRLGLSEEEAFELLCEYSERCNPPWDETTEKGPDSLRRLLRSMTAKGKTAAPFSRKPSPALDVAKVAEMFAAGIECDLETWRQASAPEPRVSHLYAPGEIVNLVTSAVFKEDKWKPSGHGYMVKAGTLTSGQSKAVRNLHPEAGAWMRPNPVKPGSLGSSDADVSIFRFVVMESDSLPRPLQLRVLGLLRSLGLPVALLVDSGVNSYHAWVRVDAANEKAYRAMAGRLLALPLGFDKACRNPSRLSRLPGVNRGEALQELVFINGDVKPLDEATLALIEAEVSRAAECLAPPVPAGLPVQAYYDAQQKEYLNRNERGVWRSYSEAQFKRILKSHGISASIPKDENGVPMAALSAIDHVLLMLQDRHDVDYHGSLCGRGAGFYEENGIRFLVTNSPRLIEPVCGQWDTLKAFFAGLIRDNEPKHGEAQWNTLHGWMQTAVIALLAGKIQQAQALALAGPPDCGKSLAQQLFTLLLGGRAAKAAHFMNGRTDFNGELFEAEHLVLEDEFMSIRTIDRLRLGAAIKGMTVSTSLVSCQRKHRHPVNLPAWWRVTITLNDEPEALLVLPPLDEHIADKIILLRASRFTLPMPTDTTELRGKFWQTLVAEIPAYLHWLLHEFKIPAAYSDPKRYVVATWHHPVMKRELEGLSPEAEMLNLIDRSLWSDGKTVWEGTADALRAALLEDYRTHRDAERLIGGWLAACGTYLGRLSKKNPDRVQQARTMHSRDWIIRAVDITQ